MITEIKELWATTKYRTLQKYELVGLKKCKIVFLEMKTSVDVITHSLKRLHRRNPAEERTANAYIEFFIIKYWEESEGKLHIQ